MDNLVSQGTGATRLSFAQKAIATGMSVILAFGLSPLGQVPAYAAQKEAAPIAAQAKTATLDWNHYEQNTLVYNGEAGPVLANTKGTITETEKDGALKAQYTGIFKTLSVYVDAGSGQDETGLYDFSLVSGADNEEITVEEGTVTTGTATIKYYEVDSNGNRSKKAVTDLSENGTPYHAGTYVLEATVADLDEDTDDWYIPYTSGKTFEIPFTIAPYDAAANGAEVDAEYNTESTTIKVNASGQMPFTGKAADFKGAVKQISVSREAGEDEDPEDVLYIDDVIVPSDTSKSDYNIDQKYQTAVEPGKYDVDFTLSGDFAGKKTVPFEITRIDLKSDSVLINGVPATTTTKSEGYESAETLADVFGIAAQASGDAANPIESIVVGDVTLTESTDGGKTGDYTVSYIDKDGNETSTKPTAYATYQIALRTVNGSTYLSESGAEDDYLKTFLIINGFEIVNNTKGFEALDAQTATVEDGTFAGGVGVEAAGVKFFDTYSHEVTAAVDGNYSLSYTEWTPAMEKAFQGEVAFNSMYDNEKGYDNTNTIGKDGLKLDKNGRPTAAGDYGVIISSTSEEGGVIGKKKLEGDKTAAANKVTKDGLEGIDASAYDGVALVKFHIDPAMVESGTGTGQVTITTSAAWADEFDAAVTSSKGAVAGLDFDKVEYVKDAAKTGDDRAAKLTKGTDYTITVARADGTDLKDTKEAQVLNAGKYNVTATFKGNYDGKITLDSAYEVTPFNLATYLDYIALNPGTYMGRDLTPSDIEVDGKIVLAAFDPTADKGTYSNALKDDEDLSAAQLNTILKMSGSDATWGKCTPFVPSTAGLQYNVIVTGTGNYTGSVPTAVLETKGETTELVKGAYFNVQKLDLANTKIQFRNVGDPDWIDAVAETDIEEADVAKFVVALGEDGKAVPPEARLVVTEADAETGDAVIKQVKGADGKKADVVIPATAYNGIPTYTGNTRVSTSTSLAKASIAATANSTNFSGNAVEGYYKVVAADQTPEKQGYTIELKEGATYNGKVQDPGLKVWQANSDGTKTQASPSDYKVYVTKASDNTTAPIADVKFQDADTYTISVKFNALAGSLLGTYTISPLEVAQADVQSDATKGTGLVISFAKPYYTGSAIDFLKTTTTKDEEAGTEVTTNDYLTIKYNGIALEQVESTDTDKTGYVVDAKEFKQTKAGTYEGTFEFKGNLSGTVKQSFEIRAVPLTGNIGSDGDYKLYFNGKIVDGKNNALATTFDFDGLAKDKDLAITLVKGGRQVGDASDMRVEYVGDTTNVGNFVTNILFTGGNYTGTAAVTSTIKAGDIADTNITVSFTNEELAYTGGAVQPKGTLVLKNTGDGYTLREGIDYTIKYGTPATQVGEKGTVIYEATSTGNFWSGKGQREAEFEVKEAAKKDIEVAAPTAKTGLKYTGSAQTGVAAAAGYTVTGGSATNAGSYKATATLADGYVWADGTKDAKTVSWSIAQAANTLTVKAKSPSVKASKVKTKKRTIKAAKAFNVTKNVSGGKVTYAKTSGSKKVNVASNGKVTVKKGTKKGTYTVKVKATSKATANYTAKTTAAFKLKVKVK